MENKKLNWAVLGVGVIANEMAQALQKMGKKLIVGDKSRANGEAITNVMWHVRQAEYDRTSEHNSWHTGTVIYTYGLAV